MLAHSEADFLFVKEFETGGKFSVAWTRRASNPYPKVFCVLTSVCVTRNDEEASAPTFILAINNPTENYVRTQAVFLATASFSLRTASSLPLITPQLNYTTALILQQQNREVCRIEKVPARWPEFRRICLTFVG
ncbi:MAG TPA: hypothetical protein VFQ24_01485 [Terriglobia bacterium]|nr:hypothetical protein [Terriglobia bacterium]